MRPDEYVRHDAVGLAELVRQGEVTALELLETATAAIEELDPHLNAVIHRQYDRARRAVDQGLPDGPLTGVPYLVKEELPMEGAPFTLACRALRDLTGPTTHEIARRLEASGLVVLGRTNMCELGLLPTTESVLYGPTRSPWHPERSPGGSSGGSAAAVAAGLVPAAHGSDGGGSIRIPASACGLFGLKPSRGRVPGSEHDDPVGFVSIHALTRSVRDSALLLDVIRGRLPGDGWWVPEPPRPYREVVAEDPPPLRIAWTDTDFAGRRSHPDCRAAVEATAVLCEELGHRVEQTTPDVDGASYNAAFPVLWSMMVGYVYRMAAQEFSRRGVPRRLASPLRHPPLLELAATLASGAVPFEPVTRRLARMNARFTPGDLWLAWNDLHQAGRQLGAFLDRYDLLLTPVLGDPPWPLGHLDPHSSEDELAEHLLGYAGYTPICNTAGLPAMSVPLHVSEAGLPIGSQFIAPLGGEHVLFALAGQLERARPWFDRRPPLFVGG